MKACPTCYSTFADDVGFCPFHGEKLTSVLDWDAAGHEGSKVAGYKLERCIRTDALGALYRASKKKKHYALRLLYPQMTLNEERIKAFIEDTDKLETLAHDGLVATREHGRTDEGVFYTVEDWIEGESLRDILIDSGHLKPTDAVSLTRLILEALSALHDVDLAHGYLSPDNIHIERTANGRRKLRLSDTGLWRIWLVNDPEEVAVDHPGLFEHKSGYMAPELITGDGASPSTDVYSAGSLLFEMLVGRTPFENPSPSAMFKRHLVEDPLPATLAKPGLEIPEDLQDLLSMALGKSSKERFKEASAFRNGLVNIFEPSIDEKEGYIPEDVLPDPSLALSRPSLSAVAKDPGTQNAKSVKAPLGATTFNGDEAEAPKKKKRHKSGPSERIDRPPSQPTMILRADKSRVKPKSKPKLDADTVESAKTEANGAPDSKAAGNKDVAAKDEKSEGAKGAGSALPKSVEEELLSALSKESKKGAKSGQSKKVASGDEAEDATKSQDEAAEPKSGAKSDAKAAPKDQSAAASPSQEKEESKANSSANASSGNSSVETELGSDTSQDTKLHTTKKSGKSRKKKGKGKSDKDGKSQDEAASKVSSKATGKEESTAKSDGSADPKESSSSGKGSKSNKSKKRASTDDELLDLDDEPGNTQPPKPEDDWFSVGTSAVFSELPTDHDAEVARAQSQRKTMMVVIAIIAVLGIGFVVWTNLPSGETEEVDEEAEAEKQAEARRAQKRQEVEQRFNTALSNDLFEGPESARVLLMDLRSLTENDEYHALRQKFLDRARGLAAETTESAITPDQVFDLGVLLDEADTILAQAIKQARGTAKHKVTAQFLRLTHQNLLAGLSPLATPRGPLESSAAAWGVAAALHQQAAEFETSKELSDTDKENAKVATRNQEILAEAARQAPEQGLIPEGTNPTSQVAPEKGADTPGEVPTPGEDGTEPTTPTADAGAPDPATDPNAAGDPTEVMPADGVEGAEAGTTTAPDGSPLASDPNAATENGTGTQPTTELGTELEGSTGAATDPVGDGTTGSAPGDDGTQPPIEATAANTEPADTKPADTKPADTKPADTKPADTKPADTKKDESKEKKEEPKAKKEEPKDEPKSDAKSTAELLKEGDTALKAGKDKDAERAYKAVLNQSSKNTRALVGLAEVYWDRRDFAKAAKYYEKATQASPRNGGYRVKLGNAYIKQKKYKKALTQYEKAKEVARDSKTREAADRGIAIANRKLGN